MKNLLFLILFLLATVTTSADVYQSPSGVGSCTIPDDSTLTSITVTPNSNQLWNPSTSCAYSFSGGTGWTLAVGTDLEYGEVTFDEPVSDVSYNFDYSYWFISPGTITYLPQNPNGEGFIAGPVSSIFWMSPANDSLNYNGIISLSFGPDLPADSVLTVPESSTSILLLIGVILLCVQRIFRRVEQG